MASAAEIKAIRALQRAATASGEILSFADARKQLREGTTPLDPQGAIGPLQERLTKLEAEHQKLLEQVEGMRITGKEFSGQGPRGIIFKPEIDPSSFRSTMEIREEGAVVSTAPTFINFIGGLITAAGAGAGANITVTTPTPYNLDIKKDASTVVAGAISIAFVGSTTAVADLGGGNARVTITPLKTQNTGSDVTDPTTTMNFVGGGVAVATPGAGIATVTIAGVTSSNTGSGAAVLKAGSATTVVARRLVEGTGIDITENADDITIALSGSSPAEISIEEEGDEITDAVTSINFEGETITAAAAGDAVTVTMQELVFRVCIGGTATDLTMPAVPYP